MILAYHRGRYRLPSRQKNVKKVTLKEWVFVELAFNMQCYRIKNTLLHIAFFSNFDGWVMESSLSPPDHVNISFSTSWYHFDNFRWYLLSDTIRYVISIHHLYQKRKQAIAEATTCLNSKSISERHQSIWVNWSRRQKMKIPKVSRGPFSSFHSVTKRLKL